MKKTDNLHPLWFILSMGGQQSLREFQRQTYGKIIRAPNSPPPVTIPVNLSDAEYVMRLKPYSAQELNESGALLESQHNRTAYR